MNKLRLGIGTGRCGTVSLAKMIDGKHELRPLLPWERDWEVFSEHRRNIEQFETNCFVAFYYLKYLPELFELYDLRVVCLKRDRQETIESYLRKVPNQNHWGKGGKNEWSKCYPTYNLADKRKAIACYYDEYYRKAERLVELTDHFKVFSMQSLNSVEGQREIMNHLELEFNGFEKYHYNASN